MYTGVLVYLFSKLGIIRIIIKPSTEITTVVSLSLVDRLYLPMYNYSAIGFK